MIVCNGQWLWFPHPHVNVQGLLGYKGNDRAVEMQESKGEEGSEGLQEYLVSEKTYSL